MKVIAILLMLLGVCSIAVFALFFVIGFVFSFDEPGSAEDPKAWLVRFLFFTPVIVLAIVLFLQWNAYRKGKIGRSVTIGAISFACVATLIFLFYWKSYSDLNQYKQARAKEEEEALLYPKQKYLRHVGSVTDTIIVYPNRIVAYRLFSAPGMPHSGPLGDLNESRDTLLYRRHFDTKIGIDELAMFTDAQGRRFVEVYGVK